MEFNGYKYHNIVTNGKLEKQLFNGFFSINDSSLQATLNGLVNINGPRSQFNFVADVDKANLQALNFTKDNVNFNGRFNLNFTGNNIDNFLGTARITQANLVRNDQRLTFAHAPVRDAHAIRSRRVLEEWVHTRRSLHLPA